MLGVTSEKNDIGPQLFDECRNAFFMPLPEIERSRIIEGLPDRATFE